MSGGVGVPPGEEHAVLEEGFRATGWVLDGVWMSCMGC